MLDVPNGSSITAARISELLAPTLGWEKSCEVVDAAVGRLGFSPQDLSIERAFAVLEELAKTPGMVGITARFARSRLDASRVKAPVSAVVPTSAHAATALPPSARPVGSTVTADEIAELLSSAMGADKAREIVLGAVRRLGFSRDRLDKLEAMTLLDHLAGESGVVGLCARFGKARLILRFAA